MLKKLLASCAVSMLLVAPTTFATAASTSNLAAGKMCASKLYAAAHGKSPAVLMQQAEKLVNFDHVIEAAAALNGVTLTPAIRAKYKEGMADFAEHFVIPRLTKQLQHAPHITVATASGNTLTISDGSDGSLTVLRTSCQILNFKGSGVSLIGMLANHVKANFS